MNKEEILLNLCYYDKRNPNSKIFDEDDFEEHDKEKFCSCDNCFRNKTQLAEELLKLTEEFEQYKKESLKWDVIDFLDYDAGDGWSITEEQAGLALEEMIRKSDCNYGTTWDDVEYYYKEYGTHEE